MGYFDDCDLDDRFRLGLIHSQPVFEGNHVVDHWYCIVYDWDQRRTVTVFTPSQKTAEDEEFVFEALDNLLDSPKVPPNAVSITLSTDGKLRSFSTNPDEDNTLLPYYPLVTDFPSSLARLTIPRSSLTEVDRLGVQTDHVIYATGPKAPPRHAVFKYYFTEHNLEVLWVEMNCIIRLPSHPNIVSFDRLVTETVGKQQKVVGFTTVFCPGGSVDETPDRVFKLKYLKQLLETIDYLNFTLGVVHGDICPHNLLIDEITDNVKIFDFNAAYQIGDAEARGHNRRDDVHYAIVTVFEIITRSLAHHFDGLHVWEIDTRKIFTVKPWKKHPDVSLDKPEAEYRNVLEKWVKSRESRDKQKIPIDKRHWIQWPERPDFPEVWFAGDMVSTSSQMRGELVRAKYPYIEWQRPPSRHLPLVTGQSLLATGQVVGQRRSGRKKQV